MRRILLWVVFVLLSGVAGATDLARVHGVVHDAQHRPVKGAVVTLRAARSSFAATAATDAEGEFAFAAVPLGEYTVTVAQAGFATATQAVVLVSGASAMVHVQLQVAAVEQSVRVAGTSMVEGSVTPVTLVSPRGTLKKTPGADRTNSLQMITEFVSWRVHDARHAAHSRRAPGELAD